MDVMNIDGANGNEAPGWRNSLSLKGEIWETLVGDAELSPLQRQICNDQIDAMLGVLRNRGLLTAQALELLQRDGDLTPLPR